MMLDLLLSIYLGVTASCSGASCANGVTATITFTATIESAKSLAWNTQEMEVEGAYALVTRAIYTGHEDAYDQSERFLVFENDVNPNKEPPRLVAGDKGLEISIKEEQWLVMKLPDGYKWPKEKELVAIRDALRDTQRSEVRIARIFKRLEKDQG